MGTDGPVIEVRDLTKRYGRFLALDRLTLSVGRGQILGFIGPNGAGKTTAIKILVGLARPTSGTATVAGIDCVARPRQLKRLIGYMPDTFGSYDNMRVGEYLDFFGAAFGIPRRARVKRIDEVLELARSTGFKDLFVESLSHGMRQRVALARTLLHDPVALILDEPANGLDPPARIEMRQLLLDLAQRGKTLIVTSHILPELARICDRVAIIARGRLRASGTLEEVARQLTPLRTIEVLLTRADGLDRAAGIVRRHAESGAEVETSLAELTVRFRTARTEEELATLLAELVGSGAGVAQFREVQTDLEEAFMTAARAGDAEAAAGAPEGRVVNPIVRRELLDLLRTRSALAILVGCALVTAVLVLVHWPAGGVGDLGGTAALGVLRALGYGLLTALLLVLPAFPASAIVRERTRGTLALLLNSPMPPRSIYAGKLGGILGFTLILLLLTAPGAAASYALGGSTATGGVGLLYAVLAVLAVQIATVGLFVSGRAQGTDGALRVTYAAVLALCILPLAAHWLLPRDGPVTAALAAWLGCFSPVPAVMEAVGHGRVGLPGEDYGGGAVARYACVALVTSALLALASIRALGRTPLDRSRAAGVMTDDRSSGARALRRLVFLVDPNRRSGGTSRFINPVLVKELRTRRFGRAHWTLRLLAGTAVLSLALSYIAASGALGWGVDVIGGALVLMQSALLVLFVPSLSAGLISSEREGGTWQLLRSTPLSAGAILRGKLMSAVWPVLLLLCATMPGYVVLATVQPETAPQIGRVLACLGLLAVFAVLVGAVASSLFRSTAVATAVSYVVLALVCVAPLLVWLGREAPFSHRAVEVVLMIDPVAAALSAANTPGFARYDLLPFNWWALGGASFALLVVLVVRTRRLYRPD